MKTFIAAFFITFSAMAADWSDLEAGETYKLNQSIQLPQVERSHSLMDFSKGEELYLFQQMPLPIPGSSMMKYIFHFKNCPGPQMVTDAIMLSIEGTSPVVKVIAALEENCELSFYVEGRYYYSPSLFE